MMLGQQSWQGRGGAGLAAEEKRAGAPGAGDCWLVVVRLIVARHPGTGGTLLLVTVWPGDLHPSPALSDG